ncbi:hypothetical protein KRP22_014332 [Phytophthora ramorum]|nr:hypothetical protein KRP22_9067 [Phytophthora ramorum]
MDRGAQAAPGGNFRPSGDEKESRVQGESEGAEVQQAEWEIAGTSTARRRSNGNVKDPDMRSAQGQQQGKQSDKKRSPRKQTPKGRNAEGSKWLGGGKEEGIDLGDGRVAFTQLKRYLLQEAPQDYVLSLVERLDTLASARRFQAFQTRERKKGNKHDDEKLLKEQWQDKPTARQCERYQKLESYWDLSNHEHGRRLYAWIKEWIVSEGLPQNDVEARLQFCHFEKSNEVDGGGSKGEQKQGLVHRSGEQGTRREGLWVRDG